MSNGNLVLPLRLSHQDSSESTTESASELSPVMKCITAIPICGGFCAKTQNPETSFLRHYSNETTPPQPCLSRYVCRKFWEHSPWCRCIGSIGTEFGDKNRSYIMYSAFVVSFIAWILTFAAFAGTSSSASTIIDNYWAKSKAVFSPDVYPPAGATVMSYVGINVRVDVLDTSTSTVKWSEPDSCEIMNGVSYPKCQLCEPKAQEAMQWLVVGALTQIFQMTTDLQRTTSYGDLNCQKSLGVFTGIFGAFTTLQSLRTFMTDCADRGNFDYFAHKVQTVTVVNATGTGIDGTVTFELNGGPGFVLLFLATFLKLYDVVCHVIVPTPLSKRQRAETELTLVEYMLRTKAATHFGRLLPESAARGVTYCAKDTYLGDEEGGGRAAVHQQSVEMAEPKSSPSSSVASSPAPEPKTAEVEPPEPAPQQPQTNNVLNESSPKTAEVEPPELTPQQPQTNNVLNESSPKTTEAKPPEPEPEKD